MTLLCGPRCAVYLPGPVSNKPLFSQSFQMVIAEGRLAILTGAMRAEPVTTVVTDRLRPAQNKTNPFEGGLSVDTPRSQHWRTAWLSCCSLLLGKHTHVDTRMHVHAHTHSYPKHVCLLRGFLHCFIFLFAKAILRGRLGGAQPCPPLHQWEKLDGFLLQKEDQALCFSSGFHRKLQRTRLDQNVLCFYFSFQDENFVFEEFARQNLKDAGEYKEEKTEQEAAMDE